MPTDALLLSIAIFLAFALFAAVLAWLDHSTTAWLRAKQEADSASSPVTQSSKKAA